MSSEWLSSTLGGFVRLQRGHDLTASEQQHGDIPIMGSAGPNGTHSTALANGPGVVVGRSGASAGRVHFSEVDFWPHNTCLYVTDFQGNSPRFAYYLLQTLDLASFNSGSAQPSLNRNFLYAIPVKIPSRVEQDGIVALLQSLDNRITLLRETNTTLEAIAQALFKSWFVDFDPVRTKMEGRAPEGMDEATAALFPDSFEESELGLVPKGWQLARLGNLCSLQKGCSYKGEGLSEDTGAYMFNLGCFNAPRVFAFEKLKRYTGEYKERHTVRFGDLIVANTDVTQTREILGRPLIVPDGISPAFVSHHVYKVCIESPDAVVIRPFLYFSFLQKRFRERAVGYATGTTVLGLPREAVEEHMLALPTRELLSSFFDIWDPIFFAIHNNEKQAQTLATLRDTLLPRLISGALRLPEAQAVTEEALA